MTHTAYTFPLVSQYHLELDDMAKIKNVILVVVVVVDFVLFIFICYS